MAITADSCIVALIGRDDGARSQLRQALEELGATVAFESGVSTASAAGILEVRPNVVIVNLEESADEDLDHLQDVFDAPSINVVFNDADVSRTLEGWDLARWARHLAAKVLGSHDTMPPAPVGAARVGATSMEAVSQVEPASPVAVMEVVLDAEPGAMVEPAIAEEPVSPPVVTFDEPVVAVTEVVDESVAEVPPQAEALGIDLSMLEMAMGLDEAPAPQRLEPVPEPVDSQMLDSITVEDIDFTVALGDDVATAVPDAPMSAQAQEAATDDELESITFSNEAADAGDEAEPVALQWSLDEVADARSDDAVAATAAEQVESFDPVFEEYAEAGESITFTSDAPEAEDETDYSSVSWSLDDAHDAQAEDGNLLDDDVAALAAQLDAFEADATSEAMVADLDFSASLAADETVAEPAPVAKPEPVASAKAASIGLGSLSLTPMGDDEPVAVAPAVAEPAKPGFDFSAVGSFSLEPIEEEAAATAPEVDPLLLAMGLVDAPSLQDFNKAAAAPRPAVAGIEHVVVLGASIGGPDALRSFLGELPAGFPALVLIVQHLESGYFERLGQQLQKSSPLPVKVASAEAKAAPGEILVIPASHRVSVETDGRVVFVAHAEKPRYTPSIDDVLRDVADRFGKRALAIIFSGMAGDAVEGAVYLTAKGGEVWAQDPQSCVVSSMVDGARARGVVEFTGSPRELAQRCVARFTR